MRNYLLFYTNRVPAGFAGVANAFVIRIRPERTADKGLLEHEKVHVNQWWRSWGLHSFLYLFSAKYRLKSEIEAYRVQLKYVVPGTETETRIRFAKKIAMKYDLSITEQQATLLLS